MRRVVLLAFLALVLPTVALATPVPSGGQGLISLGPDSADTNNISTATSFTLGSLQTNFNQSGIFVSKPPQMFGSVTFNITSPTGLMFSNSAFGSFTSTSITKEAAPPGFENIFVVGVWTPGTLFSGLTGGPFPAEIRFSFSQSAPGQPIGIGASFKTPVIPEPSTLGLLGTGLISLAGLARRKLKLLS